MTCLPPLIDLFVARLVRPIHRRFLAERRIKKLLPHVLNFIPADQDLYGVDIGCGSGALAQGLMNARPRVRVSGVDIDIRTPATIASTQFNGRELPFATGSIDFTLLVDVLHHTHEPAALLKEAQRVTRKFIVLKDHFHENVFDLIPLYVMDWVANRPYGVPLTYNYLPESRWDELYQQLGLQRVKIVRSLGLYPWPFTYICDGYLHFVAMLEVKPMASAHG